MVIALAELVRTRQAYDEIYAERAAQLERERATLAEKAVNEERLRIARELHDVVAHAISLIAVQSSVALERLRKDPDATSRALGTIETSSRGALAEMRRMLAILRHDDESLAQLQPSPGWRTCRPWLREAATAGVVTRLVVEGERPLAVPSGVDLCGYRIVQEALTNVVKHAPGASGRVVGALAPGRPRRSRSATTVTAAACWARPRARRSPGTVCSGCASGWPCSAGRSRPVRGPTVAGGSSPTCRSRRPRTGPPACGRRCPAAR